MGHLRAFITMHQNERLDAPHTTRTPTRTCEPPKSRRPICAFLFFACSSMNLAHAGAPAATMESTMMSTMESAVTRHGRVDYESAVTWGRDANFNQQTMAAPGWQLNATAIGNLINVQMAGSANTVVINAMQVNTGQQNATIMVGTNRSESMNKKVETQNQKIGAVPGQLLY